MSCDFPLSVQITRTGAPLEINDRASMELVEWVTPDAQRREHDVRGTFQAGGLLISSVPDVASLSGAVRCMGATWVEVVAAANDLRAALNQFSYSITESVDGVVTTYTKCRPTGLTMTTPLTQAVINRRAVFAFSINYHPNIVEA